VSAQDLGIADLANLSLEDLINMDVTSVSRRSENLSEAPAAIYVISREDILRSGVTSIAEALRLAPGVEVARRSSNAWSISIRGFNSDITNKLLVLIDGRSVYSPLYAGVFWDVQDMLLEDVERIEVIAGPGGTMWGANAVNGVINIISRSSAETQGGYIEAGGGNKEKKFGSVRYGMHINEDIAARAYFKYFDRDASELAATGMDGEDNWEMLKGGFRLDWEITPSDNLMLQGDVYSGDIGGMFRDDNFTLGTLPGPDFVEDAEIVGHNLLGNWSRDLESGANLRLQVYYDHTRRNIPGNFNETRDTLDVDFQHQLTLGDSHDIVWGAGFRETSDEIGNTAYTDFDPDARSDQTFSFFLQDKITLWQDRWFLTLGSKFEDNDYSGFEVQPNARLSWLATERQTLWVAVSRAVRIPSRLDTDLRVTVPFNIGFPAYVTINGNLEFKSERLLASEAGYRIQALDNLSFDATVFYHDYNNLQSAEPGTAQVFLTPVVHAVLPNLISNGIYGEGYGTTLMTIWKPLPSWRLQLHYTYFDLHTHNLPTSRDVDPETDEGNSPDHQFSVHSYVDLPYNFSLYTGLRYVDELPEQEVEDYLALDISLQWRPVETIELSLTAQNAADKRHLEFGEDNLMERGIYGKAVWRF
jgi:iron complex outermembrane receptor protein